ncbi:MAG: RsmB/NOP family class I SAM-dependent RNA methyltransferase [Myxococcota bacterium]
MTGARPSAGKIAVARLAAARSLLDTDEGIHLEDALARHAPPAGPDRDLAWFLAYGVLRRRGQVDAALRGLLNQPLASLDGTVRVALRIGAFERLFARTPSHAVVDQGVELVRALGTGRAHGLVNAILRKVRPAERLGAAEAVDHPSWLFGRWVERYGAEAATTWAQSNSEEPPLFVVQRGPDPILPPGAEPVERGGERVPGVFRLTDREGGPIPSRAGFAEGHWWVQDLASVLVADLVPADGTVLDACAAPGGKSFRLRSRGARVTATDRNPTRIGAITAGADRLGWTLETHVVDWTRSDLADRRFDAVLVDAPCTGLGTVRRHPEIRWRRTPDDLFGAADVQREVLRRAAVHVRPGGALVYAVCSPEPEEGELVVRDFLATHRRFAVEHTLELAPPQQGEDAHYAVRLRSS